MLESVVARLLNQLLGKYVVDLDTENLNVGIFSGQVQLTDLQLKPEALFTDCAIITKVCGLPDKDNTKRWVGDPNHP
ncbi:hypothetical protein FQA39_LY07473 [Lamprigera yunnana]|nr:hypothetical protein FQA39_LY07473 [Lamprigera yunnana]